MREDADMSTGAVEQEQRTQSAWWLWAILGVVGALIVGGFVANKISEQRAADRRSDGYYCTLAGVGPYDRAPRTGELCIDL